MAKDQSMNDQMRVRRQKMQELRDEVSIHLVTGLNGTQ